MIDRVGFRLIRLQILSAIVLFGLFSSCQDIRSVDYETPELNFETAEKNGFILPEDWEVSLWAESPILYNPTNMDVDLKGRIWVTEAVNYRDFNNSPEDHLNFIAGDRIMILEDTDGDGLADSSKVFAQDKDLVAPLGIAVVGNKVFVSCAPSLFVYTDEDGDDVADKKEVFLSGFGGLDHDHSLHSLVVGPDGNYYFNVGNAGPHHVVDKSGWRLRSGSVYTGGSPYNRENEPAQVSDDGRIWVGGLALRIEKDGTGLEVVGHNFRNSYEVALDSYGNMWQNDNDDQVVTCRVSYLMEGGNAGYFSANGKRTWQADQRPGQAVFTSHWHQDDPGVIPAGDNTGAGSPTGVVVYEGDAFGPKYQGMLLSADAGRNVIFAYQASAKGAGFGLERKDLITSVSESTEDYVWNDIDEDKRKWFRPSDIAVGTDGAIYIADWYDPVVGGHQMMDSIGYGRIYRLTPKGENLKSPVLDLTTTEGQIEALLNPAINVRSLGFEKLKDQGEDAVEAVSKILESENSIHRARAVWLLSNLGNKGINIVEDVLKNEADPRLRVTAYRALRNYQDSLLQFASIAAKDPSKAVRREVALSMRDIPWEMSADILMELLTSYEGKDDWYLEALGMGFDGKEELAYKDLLEKKSKNPLNWSDEFAKLVWRMHPNLSISALKERALSERLSEGNRKMAVDALAFIVDEEAVLAMMEISSKAENKVIQDLSSWWLDFRSTNDWFHLWDWNRENGIALEIPEDLAKLQQIIVADKTSKEEKIAAAIKMAEDLIGGRLLIDMASNAKFSDEFINEVSASLFANPYLEIRTLADEQFKNPKENNYSISKILDLDGEAEEGKIIFSGKCAICHKSQDGGNDVGPNLSRIGSKFDKNAMLDAIINPNSSLVFGYEPVKVKIKSGQVFYGFLLSEGETLVLKDALGGRIVIAIDEVESKERMEIGLMPSPMNLDLTEQDLSDLTAYLLTLK